MLCPDIVGVAESWAHEDISDSELSVDGFDMFRCDRTLTRGGGVLLYMRSELHPTVFIPDAKFPEQIWCELHANTTHSLKTGVVYRTTSKSLYNDKIDELMRTLMKEMSNQHFVLMGDFNYPDIDWLQRQYTLPVSQEGKQFWKSSMMIL